MVTNPSLWLIPKVAQQKIRTELRFELPSKKTAFKVKTIKKKKNTLQRTGTVQNLHDMTFTVSMLK